MNTLFDKICGAVLLASFAFGLASAQEKVVFVPGPDSHGYGQHSHIAGVRLLADRINEYVPSLTATVLEVGWPSDLSVFDGAAAVIVFSNGGAGSMLDRNFKDIEALVEKGVGIGLLHYAVEVPKGEAGNALLSAIGGYFETHWSVNPFFVAEFKEFPNHPVARGLRPFSINDEWYYHMRFAPPSDNTRRTDILVCIPPDSTRDRPDGAHSGNPTVRANRGGSEVLCWVYERDTTTGKGRGFGFTGGHDHWNWGHPMFLRTVLNAIVWTAGAEVPEGGVAISELTLDELVSYLPSDELTPDRREQIERRLVEWRQQ